MEAGLTLAAALEHAVAKLERSLPELRAFVARGLLPNVTENGRWELLPPLDQEYSALTGLPWTGGFVAGQLWLAGLHDDAAAVTDLLAPRAERPDTHDLGFLFWPSAVLGHRATGDERYRELALRAASSLARRALPNGVIQVIGPLDDPEYRGRSIVDTLPNLLLLWWAGAHDAALAHLRASLPAFVRPDGSTFHFARFADGGAVVEQGTINGYAPDSTWARGQAWAIHGLVSAFRATGGPELGAAAARCARWFLDRLPPDLVPPWDFDAPAGGPKDASAAAIAASALLELPEWRADGVRLLEALVERCLSVDEAGLLLHCCYRWPIGKGLDCATTWGDFFLLDALLAAVAPERRLSAF